MKRILVTGGLGFVGSHTCVELLKKDYIITIIDSLINSKIDTIRKIKSLVNQDENSKVGNLFFELGDIRDFEFLENLFHSRFSKGFGFDAVVHFCGLKSVEESVKSPLLYWDVNVLGTINLLKVMKKYSCYNLVFSSSATVYGNTDLYPIKENARIKPINTYGETKAIIEKLLFEVQSEFNSKFNIAILRYFNPVGAHISGLIGESPVGKPNNIFPILNRVAYSKNDNFEIFGKDWPTRDGTCIRDYIHVMDLAEGHLLALEFLKNNEKQIEIFNLGSEKGTTVLELIKTFQKVNNIDFSIIYSEKRKGDVGTLIADISFAKKILNWIPKRNLEMMCKDSWNFFLRDNSNFQN